MAVSYKHRIKRTVKAVKSISREHSGGLKIGKRAPGAKEARQSVANYLRNIRTQKLPSGQTYGRWITQYRLAQSAKQ